MLKLCSLKRMQQKESLCFRRVSTKGVNEKLWFLPLNTCTIIPCLISLCFFFFSGTSGLWPKKVQTVSLGALTNTHQHSEEQAAARWLGDGKQHSRGSHFEKLRSVFTRGQFSHQVPCRMNIASTQRRAAGILLSREEGTGRRLHKDRAWGDWLSWVSIPVPVPARTNLASALHPSSHMSHRRKDTSYMRWLWV